MPRNHVLGSCWRLLGILVLMRAQRAEGQSTDGNARDIVPGCRCQLGLDCPQTGEDQSEDDPCIQGQYCSDQGFDFTSKRDNSPDCKECKSGYYFSNSTALQPHQSVRGRDEIRNTYTENPDCADLGSDVACPKIKKTEIVPGDRFFQNCQHCPVNTIVNSEYGANKGARCFYSCSDAYAKMKLTETLLYVDMQFESPKLVNSLGNLEVQNTPSTIFLGGGAADYILKSFHSQVKLDSTAIDVAGWMKTTKYQEYREYTTDQREDFYQILRLPPPPRICVECAAGTSMFFVSCEVNGGPDCEAFKTQIQALKADLSSTLQSYRLNDISWLFDLALTPFRKMGVCVPCPIGTYNSNELDIDATDYLGTKLWTMRQLRCRPCGYGTYTNAVGQKLCKICGASTFVQAQYVDVRIRTTLDYEQEASTSANLLTSCVGCPPGTQYSPDAMAIDLEKKCSSIGFAMKQFNVPSSTLALWLPESAKCCRPCELNHYKEKMESVQCRYSTSPTLAPYGQINAMTCSSGQQKKFCMVKDWSVWDASVSPCTEQGSSNTDSDWITCVSCLKTEKPKISKLLFHECQLCNEQVNQEQGEYLENGMCKTCNGCYFLKTQFNLEPFEWEGIPGYTALLQMWVDREIDSKSTQWQGQWKYQKVSVECAPLTRRVMGWDEVTKTISITGVDHYKAEANDEQKKDGRLFIEKPVVKFHAMDYGKLEDNKESTCEYKRCEKFCENFYYQYSSGCGQDLDPWVASKISVTVELSRKSALQTKLASSNTMPGDLKSYVIVPRGKCELCEECDPGYYNPDCNKWEEVVADPAGTCRKCSEGCPAGSGKFLWHANGLRGCDPGGDLHGNGKVQVLTDYECRQCPTWIKRNGGRYAVLGCGNKATFGYFKNDPDPMKGAVAFEFSTTEVNTKISADGFPVERPDVDIKFKPFVYPVDYCPDGYYFDEGKTGCDFQPLSYTLENGESIEHGVDPYNLECCEKCGDCDPAHNRRDQRKWRRCDGSTLSDTQKDHCFSKCPSGSYKNTVKTSDGQLECVPCTRCQNP